MSESHERSRISPLNWLPRRPRSDYHCGVSCGDACHHEAPNRSGSEPFTAILNRRVSRRSLIRAVAVGAPLLALSSSPLGSQLLGPAPLTKRAGAGFSTVGIESIPNELDDWINVPPGYSTDVLLLWGDPILPDAPAFDLYGQSAAAVARQFGYNGDLNIFIPLYPDATQRGLLSVNHEYISGVDMFPGYIPERPTEEQVRIEIASHGMSVVEVEQTGNGLWSYLPDSRFNRRITGTTPMQLTGPAADHSLLQTSTDPTGRHVLGMFNNCAGGKMAGVWC